MLKEHQICLSIPCTEILVDLPLGQGLAIRYTPVCCSTLIDAFSVCMPDLSVVLNSCTAVLSTFCARPCLFQHLLTCTGHCLEPVHVCCFAGRWMCFLCCCWVHTALSAPRATPPTTTPGVGTCSCRSQIQQTYSHWYVSCAAGWGGCSCCQQNPVGDCRACKISSA